LKNLNGGCKDWSRVWDPQGEDVYFFLNNFCEPGSRKEVTGVVVADNLANNGRKKQFMEFVISLFIIFGWNSKLVREILDSGSP
jgi:hypothetical protein